MVPLRYGHQALFTRGKDSDPRSEEADRGRGEVNEQRALRAALRPRLPRFRFGESAGENMVKPHGKLVLVG